LIQRMEALYGKDGRLVQIAREGLEKQGKVPEEIRSRMLRRMGGHIGVVAGDQAAVYSVVQSPDGPARDDVGRAVQEHGGGGQSGGGVVLYRKICAQIAD